MNDLAGNGSAREQPLDHVGVVPRRHKADVLAVGLVGVREAKFARQLPHPRLRHFAKRKPQARQLRARGGEQEIALVAIGVGGPVERPPAPPVVAADDIMSRRQEIGAEVVRRVEEVGELQVLIAGDARHRRLAGDIGSGERLDHLLTKALFVIEHIVGNPETRRDVPRIMDILAGAARAFAMRRLAVVIELHCNADDVIAFGGQQRRRDRRVDAARHRDDDAGLGGDLIQSQAVQCAVQSRRERWREHDDLLPAKCDMLAYVGLPARFAKAIAQFGGGRHSWAEAAAD